MKCYVGAHAPFEVSSEGIVTNVGHFFGVPAARFRYLFQDLPAKKYRLIGQVFCRPVEGYKPPTWTFQETDPNKVVPRWPTVKNGHKLKVPAIERGMDYDDVLKKWTKFANLFEGIAAIKSSDDAGKALDTLVDKVFTDDDLSPQGLSKGLRFKMVRNVWPTDKWFKDVSYRIVDQLEKQASRVTKAAAKILDNSYSFETKSEAFGCSGKSKMLARLISFYKTSNTKCYYFAAQLYNNDIV